MISGLFYSCLGRYGLVLKENRFLLEYHHRSSCFLVFELFAEGEKTPSEILRIIYRDTENSGMSRSVLISKQERTFFENFFNCLKRRKNIESQRMVAWLFGYFASVFVSYGFTYASACLSFSFLMLYPRDCPMLHLCEKIIWRFVVAYIRLDGCDSTCIGNNRRDNNLEDPENHLLSREANKIKQNITSKCRAYYVRPRRTYGSCEPAM